jgi:hypothetical protein
LERRQHRSKRDGPAGEEAPAPGPPDPEAVAARAARVLLFLLPGGCPRRRAGEGEAAATGAAFFLIPLGRPGPRFLGTSTPPTAGAASTEAATAGSVAAAAARVFWLLLPNGRPRLRNTGDVVAELAAFFPLPFKRLGLRFSGAPSPPAPGPPREDMAGLRSNEERGRRSGGVCPQPRAPSAFKEEGCRKGGGRNGIGCAQCFGNCTTIFTSCAPFGRQPSRPPQRSMGGADGM